MAPTVTTAQAHAGDPVRRLRRRDLRDVWHLAGLIARKHADLPLTQSRLRFYPTRIRAVVLRFLVAGSFFCAPALVGERDSAVLYLTESRGASKWRALMLLPITLLSAAVLVGVLLVAALLATTHLSAVLLAVVLIVAFGGGTLIGLAVALAAVLLVITVAPIPAFVSDRPLRAWERRKRRQVQATLVAAHFAAARPGDGLRLVQVLQKSPALAGNRIWITVPIQGGPDDTRLVKIFSLYGFRVFDHFPGRNNPRAVGMVRDDRPPDWKQPNYEHGLGCAVLDRLILPRHIHRRVDKFVLSEAGRIRHVTSVDVDVGPELFRQRSNGRPELVIPLMFITKSAFESDMMVMRSVDLRDDAGRSLPMLGRLENACVLYSALRSALENLTGPGVDDWSLAVLWDIVMLRKIDAEGELAKVFAKGAGTAFWRRDELKRPKEPALKKAADNPAFRLLLRFAAASYLLCASADPRDWGDPPSRRILKVSREYAQVPTTQDEPQLRVRLKRFVGRFVNRVGLWSVLVHFPVQGVLPTRSQHAEVEHGGELVDLSVRGGPPLWDNRLTGLAAHVYVGRRLLADTRTVFGRFAMSWAQGVAAIVALLVLTGLLATFAWLPPDPRAESGVTLLLLFPGAVSGIVAARRQDAYASGLLRPLRLVIAVGTMSAIAGAATVLLAEGTAERLVLVILTILCGSLLLLLIWAAILVRWLVKRRLARERRPGIRVMRERLHAIRRAEKGASTAAPTQSAPAPMDEAKPDYEVQTTDGAPAGPFQGFDEDEDTAPTAEEYAALLPRRLEDWELESLKPDRGEEE